MLVEYLDRLSRASGALSILAGQSPDGEFQMIDLAKAPHALIAGTTGSGKTIFLYSIIVSLLQQYSADELEFLIVDPKQTDFHFFEGLPHLRGGRVLTDADEAITALTTINTVDKQERTEQIKAMNSRDIDSYNAKVDSGKMKRLVVVIDEYADLVQAAELQGKDVRKTFESNLCMLAQRVRNLGIHLVIATQQPRATIVTSQLKAVLPFRVSFRLPSHTDSQSYSLYAVPYKRSYIVLNTSMANRAVEASLQKRQFSFLGKRNHVLAEHRINKYKTDLYIEDTKTIIEVKSVISIEEIAKFPTVFSERSLVQLAKLKEFLADGHKVHYCIVSLNPYVKGIQILKDTIFQQMLQDCLSNGMTISGHTCRIKAGKVQLEKILPISSINSEFSVDK